MSRMIISLVISLFLLASPIVGQFIDEQTTVFTQESLHIENTVRPVEQNSIPTASDQNIINNDHKTSAEAPAADTRAISLAEKKLLVMTKVAEKEMLVSQPTPDNDPVSADQTKANSKPGAESKTTSKPAAATPSASLAAAQPTKAPEAGASPKPTETSKPTKTPKPDKPPKAPAQSESNTTESAPSSSNEKVFDTSKVSSGTLGVRYYNTSGKRIKLMVEKGDSRYTYNLDAKGSLETFPLQSGNGEYKVSIMENTTDSKYRYVLTETISVKASDSNSAYLSSIKMINWNSKMAAIKKAADLTSGVSGDEAKVKKIYKYVVANIRYDLDKLNNLPSTYIPSINDTYKSKSGICYDFASLTAAMLRSVGVPTRLIMGNADDVTGYHAWNEVYMDGKWRVIDTSYDSQMREAGASYSMIKSKSKYDKSKVY